MDQFESDMVQMWTEYFIEFKTKIELRKRKIDSKLRRDSREDPVDEKLHKTDSLPLNSTQYDNGQHSNRTPI